MLLKKMGVRPHQNLLLLYPPEDIYTLLHPAPENIAIYTEPTPGIQFQAALLFVRLQNQLPERLDKTARILDASAILWIAFPKRASAASGFLTRNQGWEPARALHLLPVSAISVNETWSALRFKPENTILKKKTLSVPEIDNVNRTIAPPPDLLAALSRAGLNELFNKLSYTHRKEYVLAILSAKKPETRNKRIEQTVRALSLKTATAKGKHCC